MSSAPSGMGPPSPISPRQPPTKRSSSSLASVQHVLDYPEVRVTNAIPYILHLCSDEATKKPPFKVEAVRNLLSKVDVLQSGVFDLVKANAVLVGRLDEARVQNA